MTAHFAIPATTVVLRAIIQRRLDAAYGTLAAPTVSVEPPPRPAPPPNGGGGQPAEPAGVHLFLHHAAPNPAWRNMYEPHLDSAGRVAGRSPLALDLHYMLAVTGADLEREVLLGLGIVALTRHGVVPRPLILAVLSGITVPANPTSLMDKLPTEPLHDPAQQPQQITLAQAPVDVDLSTKIWSALQSPMRPAAFFLATTVFLDVGDTYPAATPVDEPRVGIRPDPGRDTAMPPDVITVAEALP
ncbi:DUF4255 domain-containing protein [Cellulomonas humilata]|uniref:DUF4255 domain-containing protein n=1 Tax=Cellulomonas humilata TaxID=144055 RepID=A0A7Y6A5T3_9CELL|nr:Pvc16 family protein [Cellulomonas humilata]NUU19608.1 DUF4255 domain-containing protein [Cellulomonas humilata]